MLSLSVSPRLWGLCSRICLLAIVLLSSVIVATVVFLSLPETRQTQDCWQDLGRCCGNCLPKITAAVRNWWNQWCSSHGSLWLLFVMKKVMMVSHKVMTVLIVLLPCNFLLWRFLCILISCILSQWCPVWCLQQLDLVFPSSRSGSWIHDGAVISAVFGSIKGSSSCLLTRALLLPDVCSALCHVNLSLVACFLDVSVSWVTVWLLFFHSFCWSWSNYIVFLPQTMQE